jgi:hypothetical protein
MFFNAHLEVTIANKQLKTIVSIDIDKDGHNVGGECKLVLPLNSRIQYTDGNHDYLTAQTRSLFAVGDPVTVRAKYDNYDWITVFEGFVFDFIEGQPMTIKCLDYSYWFNLGTFGSSRVLVKKNKRSKKTFSSVGTSYKSITLKNLIENIIDFVNDTIDDKATDAAHVELITPLPDMTMVNITFAMMSPLAILEYLKKELGFNITLIRNQLYVNVASYTTNSVSYDTTLNVLKSDLQKPSATFQTYKVKAWFIREDGTKDSFEIGDSSGQLREVYFYRIKRDQALYEQLAKEALVKVKQQKYSGNITTMLYPQPILFAKATYKDKRYPDRDGDYVITGVNSKLDSSGYRHIVKLSFLTLPS